SFRLCSQNRFAARDSVLLQAAALSKRTEAGFKSQAKSVAVPPSPSPSLSRKCDRNIVAKNHNNSQTIRTVFMNRHRRILSVAVTLFCILFGGASIALAEKRPPTAEDCVMLKRPQEAQISPDGKWIAFYYTEPLLKTGQRDSNIWIVPATGG